jgi:hypothetical protein
LRIDFQVLDPLTEARGGDSGQRLATVQLEDLLRERAYRLGAAFTTKRWFEEVYSAGLIPVSLIRWQLTGKNEEIRTLLAKE